MADHQPANRAAPNEAGLWPVVRVASGDFLEMYDFMVFGYFASAIGGAFFPGRSEIGAG